MSTSVKECYSLTRNVGEWGARPAPGKNGSRDAQERHHGTKCLPNIERLCLSTENVSRSWMVHDTPSRVVQMNYVPVPLHQTRSKTRQHHLCGSMIPTTSSTLLPTKHPCREGLRVDKTAQDAEQQCSSMKRAEYELLELADGGESTQDMLSTCHNRKTRRNIESVMYSTQDQARRAQELASTRNDHQDTSRTPGERCAKEGTGERDPSVMVHEKRTSASVNESGEGLGMHLSCQGFKRLKSVENDVFSTKNISTRRMVSRTPSRVIPTSYSPHLPPNTCSETCKFIFRGHPWPRSSSMTFPMVPSSMEAPVVDDSVRNRLEGSSRRLDDSGTYLNAKMNVRCGTAHSTPSPRPQMMNKVENAPYTMETTSFQPIQ